MGASASLSQKETMGCGPVPRTQTNPFGIKLLSLGLGWEAAKPQAPAKLCRMGRSDMRHSCRKSVTSVTEMDHLAQKEGLTGEVVGTCGNSEGSTSIRKAWRTEPQA